MLIRPQIVGRKMAMNPLAVILLVILAGRLGGGNLEYFPAPDICFRKFAPQVHSADKYIDCMKCAKADIPEYGIEECIAIEAGTPITRTYDRLTCVTGSEILRRH